MVGILVLDFKVKSIVHDYEVKFIDDSASVLHDEIANGDIIIIDRKIREIYKDINDIISENNRVITIEANEDQKSYKGLIPIMNQIFDL